MQMLEVQNNVNLGPYTTFGIGGLAENFVEVHNSKQLENVLENTTPDQKIWLVGYGSNSLISDAGLAGLTICARGGEVKFDGESAIVDAGVEWDELVKQSVEHNLWGAELMSKIPGSLGGALFINITAYGQNVGELVQWVEVFDRQQQKVRRIDQQQLSWDYKSSIFQSEPQNLIILRAKLGFSKQPTTKLSYQKALDIAEELNLDPNDLQQRRQIIITARERAGSIYDAQHTNKTAGSFFRNPVVSAEQAENIISFDETGKTAQQIKKMNQIHGGSSRRVSAAHVMLAAGFNRGQKFANGRVKLNDQNLLKIEALDGASSSDVYQTMRQIQTEVHNKLNIDLQPEVCLMGQF